MSEPHENGTDNTRSFVHISKGTIVSHYRIIERIGAGGMGEVYLAEDTSLSRKVALKFLPPHLCQDEDCRKRFKREAQAAAVLEHPNIVAIHEVTEYQGRPFIVMQYIEGRSLRDILKDQELSIDEIIDLVIQVCHGLGEAHRAGVIHRDIKPSNIVIGSDGRPRILDFGLAAIKGDTHITKTGSTLGTVGYMSPEQVEGRNIDERSDLFATGVILYEMIAGRPPFRGETEGAVLKSVLNETPEPLARYRAGVTDELQRIVDEALEKDPETRYQTASGLIADLKRLKKASEPAVPVQRKESRVQPISPQRRTVMRFLVPGSLGAVIILFLLIFRPWQIEVRPTEEAIAAENRLAIMYFDNLAEPGDSRKFGEIATNLLIADLSESEYVQVVSSQRLYDILKLLGMEGEKKITRDVATRVAEKARAKWMLLGSLLQVEPQIIVMAQLVEVESGNVVASERVTGGVGEQIFSVIDKLTGEIGNDLSFPAAAYETDRPIADVTTHSPEAYRYYLEGIDYFWKRYPLKAESSFKKALEYDSTFAMAYYWLSSPGMDKSLQERKEMAAKAARFSDRTGKKEKQYIACRLATVEQDYELALAGFHEIVQQYPEEKFAFFAMGYYCYIRLKRFEDAIEYFNKAIEIDPLFTESYNQLAYLYDSLGQLEKSIWAINKYISIAPEEANPYDTKGEIYAANGILDEAIESFRKAVEIKPDFYISWNNLGHMYIFKGQYENAEKCYEKLISDPAKNTRSDGRLGLALIPLHQGKLDSSLAVLEQGIAADRMERVEEWPKHILKADIYSALDDKEQGLAEIRKGAEDYLANRNDQVVPFRHMEVLFLTELGRYDEAERVLKTWKQQIERDDPSKTGFYWLGLGGLQYSRGNYEDAVTTLTKAVEELGSRLHPAGYRARILLARTYQGWGKLGEAAAEYENLLSEYSAGRMEWCASSVIMHYYLGQIYEQSGWTSKAIEQYETFLEIWNNADEGLKSVEEAKAHLTQLKG